MFFLRIVRVYLILGDTVYISLAYGNIFMGDTISRLLAKRLQFKYFFWLYNLPPEIIES